MNRLLGIFVLITYLTLSCQPSTDNYDSIEIDDYLKPYYESFCSLYDSVLEKESFIFFTDPHLVGGENEFTDKEKEAFLTRFLPVITLYKFLPLNFCLCGGDWLKRGDTQDVAKMKLMYADQHMNSWFQPYYKMLGNHDTNYQGIVSTDNLDRGDLPIDFINNEYFKDIGRAYYSFTGENTVFYVLDSGTDWESSMNDYREAQLKWFAESLQKNQMSHIVIGMHILINSSPGKNNPTPFATQVLEICREFNDKKSYVIKGERIDYSNSIGTVHLLITGHNHIDFFRSFSIPCVGTTQFIKNGITSFDLCLIDYDNGFLEMIRVGEGENRKIKLKM